MLLEKREEQSKASYPAANDALTFLLLTNQPSLPSQISAQEEEQAKRDPCPAKATLSPQVWVQPLNQAFTTHIRPLWPVQGFVASHGAMRQRPRFRRSTTVG